MLQWLQYLGDLDEDSSGGQRTVHHDNDTPILPLLYLRDTIVFPGETLPMHIYNAEVGLFVLTISRIQQLFVVSVDNTVT